MLAADVLSNTGSTEVRTLRRRATDRVASGSTIRRLSVGDAQTYRAMVTEALIVHADSFPEDYHAQVLRPLAEVGEELESNGTFGAWIGTHLVGILSFAPQDKLKCQHRGKVKLLYVKQEHRRQGIARSLLERVLLHASNHADQVEVEVTTTSEHVVHLFEAFGFEMCGISFRGLRVDGREFDVWTMMRVLR
jgi:ribosomal protein S18 acetylase RimI-like enzyme